MAEPFKASQGSMYVQQNLDAPPEYLGCVDVDALPDPRGAISLIRCRDGNGDYVTVGEKQEEPDAVSTTITSLTYPEFDILDRIRRCAVNLFVTLDCAKRGVFGSWERADILHHAKLVTRTLTNAAMRVATDETLRALEFTGWGVLHLTNHLKLNRQSIAETTDLNAIAVDGAQVCAGDCGAAQDAGDVAFLGGDAPAGSPTSTADIWQTLNGGTWTNTVGGSAHPFAGGYDIAGAAMFDLDRSTKRWLVARESVGGALLQLAYSDDAGDTWTRVNVGAVNGEGVASAKALFARDRSHLWVATSAGNVYFSADGGVSWTLQAGAAVAGGSVQLNVIRFIDVDNGYAAGNTGVLIKTNDGGDSWAAVTAPASDNLTALEVFSPYHVMVGTNADGLYATFDAGAQWSSKTFSGQSTGGTVKALLGYGDLVVTLIHNPATGQGYFHRSIDGGNSWERKVTPVNAGLNDFALVDANNAYLVGNAYAGTGVVIKITD